MTTYHGLLLNTHHTKDAESKARSQNTLKNWQYVQRTAKEWITHLTEGHTIQPSTFMPDPDGKYTHIKDLWQCTHFVCCDADNLRAVEFLSDGTDKNPDGVQPFTSKTGLSELFPTLREKVYAVTQSVSSMHKDPPHRRYRLIFLFDEPITTEAHYHSILLTLSKEFPIIPAVERSPAQPVFGNARDGYNQAAIPGNVLSLSDYPIPEPEPDEQHTGHWTEDDVTDNELAQLLTENKISVDPRPRGGFFVPCPNSEQHTDGICNRTDAYVFISDSGGYAFHCSHASCQSTGKSTWQAFKDGYNIKTSHRTYTAKQRLFIKSDSHHIKTDVMDTIRELLKNNVLDWLLKVYGAEKKQILIVNTGTATGKSHVIMSTLENLIMLTPTKELAEEAYNTAIMDFGKNAVLHKTRWHNWTQHRDYLDNPSYNRDDLKMSLTDTRGVPCAYPERCDAIFRKGHSARNKFCEHSCDRRGECKNHGYLSQFRFYQDTAQDSLQVYTAQPQDATTDVELKETINAYGIQRNGTLLVVDEADPLKMIPTRIVSYADWREAAKFYNLTYAGVFFECLLQKTATVPNIIDTEDMETLISTFFENGLAFRDAIGQGFDAFETHVKKHGNTRKQGLKIVQEQLDEIATLELGSLDIDNPQIAPLHDGHPAKIDAQIEKLPHNHTRLISDLQALLKSTADTQTPPIRNISEGVWEFAVPPTLNAKYNIYLTASNTVDLTRQHLRNVDVDITQTPNDQAHWKQGNKLYQLHTGRYTPRSLFNKDTLTARGKDMIECIIATLADGKDTLIVAPGAFCEEGILFTDPLIQQLHVLPNAYIATHQHAIGVNRYSELPRAIVFHFEPHILNLIFSAALFFADDTLTFERTQITLEKYGLQFNDVYRYTDQQVQQVFDAMCEYAMMQSINRIRPQLYKGKEIYLLTAEPIAAPTIPMLFSLADWQAWLNTDRADTFDTFLKINANRNTAEIVAEDNISTRQAYRRTEQKRTQDKKARNAEIIRLHLQHHPQRDIAMHCKVNLATVSRVIKSFTE